MKNNPAVKPKLILGLALVLGGNCFAAIIYPPAPAGGRQVIIENAGRNLREEPNFLGGFRIEDLNIADPCREYFVGLTNLASGRLLAAAKPSGWRYLLIHGTNAVGAAGLIADEHNGGTLIFSGLHQTDFSKETLEALRMAEQLSQIKEQDYELRRLESSGVYFVAVWLHGKSDDFIIPLGPTFGRWNALQPYSESQMLKLLQPEAKKKLKKWVGMFAEDAAGTNTLRVVVIPSKTEVRVKEPFKVALRVENPAATNQMVRIWSCSWDDEWKSSNPNILFGGWVCTKNVVYDLTIPPGGAYTNELELLVPQPISDQTLTFQMGFTPIGSEKAYWSDKVKLNIISADK